MKSILQSDGVGLKVSVLGGARYELFHVCVWHALDIIVFVDDRVVIRCIVVF